MFKRPLIFLAVLLALLVIVFDNVARAFFLYWEFWWLDSVVHFLAGFAISLFVLSLCGVFNFNLSRKSKFFIAFFFSFLAGVLWEIYQYLNIFPNLPTGYIFDTVGDIVFSTAGGIAGFFYFARKEKC